MIGYEAIVHPEAQKYIGVNPACISLLRDGTRELVWGILTHDNPEQYHTIRWFSDYEKNTIEKLPTEEVQKFLSKYI